MIAVIDEAECIGCNRCYDSCPVDAIVGASGYMHQVVFEDCIDCKLCLPHCPVECISMQPKENYITEQTTRQQQVAQTKANHKTKQQRINKAAANATILFQQDAKLSKIQIKHNLQQALADVIHEETTS